MTKETRPAKNFHYSEQDGHAKRSIHAKVVRRFYGIMMPEGVPGFDSLMPPQQEQWRIRRTMRRISRTGRR